MPGLQGLCGHICCDRLHDSFLSRFVQIFLFDLCRSTVTLLLFSLLPDQLRLFQRDPCPTLSVSLHDPNVSSFLVEGVTSSSVFPFFLVSALSQVYNAPYFNCKGLRRVRVRQRTLTPFSVLHVSKSRSGLSNFDD